MTVRSIILKFYALLLCGLLFSCSTNDLEVNSLTDNKLCGVLGGSYAQLSGAYTIYESITDKTSIGFLNYAHGGYGFSSLQGSIQNLADDADVCDYYILWASTNDITNQRECGQYTDYTEYDSYDESKLTTQCGGINYCIKTLRDKNPNCVIMFISTMKNIGNDYFHYANIENELGVTLTDYVEGQRLCCENQNVPFLNLLELDVFGKEDDQSKFFASDGFHLSDEGYSFLSPYIVSFFLQNK